MDSVIHPVSHSSFYHSGEWLDVCVSLYSPKDTEKCRTGAAEREYIKYINIGNKKSPIKHAHKAIQTKNEEWKGFLFIR